MTSSMSSDVLRQRTHFFRGAAWVSASALSLALAACSVDEPVNPAAASGGAGGQSGIGAGPPSTGGDGGDGGEPLEPSRGDPSTFPTDCIEDCPTACARLAECGGSDSSIYPIDEEECLARCALQQNGPIWDDQSGTFRCCTTQESCEAVAHCGGWIKHPDAAEPCNLLCLCLFSQALADLHAPFQPPVGYRFSTDKVLVDADAATIEAIDSIVVERAFAYPVVRLTDRSTHQTVQALQSVGPVLPTFVDSAGRLSAATGRIVVVGTSSTSRKRAHDLLVQRGATHERDLHYGDGMAVYRLADPFAALALAREVDATPGVQAELDMVRHYEPRLTPNDPLFADQWHLKNTGQTEGLEAVDGRVDEAWDLTTGDAEVVIAINDNGVDLNHPDLAGKLLPELNFPADWERKVQNGEFGGHGTPCAGVAAGQGDNAIGGSGVCPDCAVLPHLLGESVAGQFQITDVDVADGFAAQVDAGAWIISNSWGPSTGNPLYVEPTIVPSTLPSVVQQVFEYAENEGRNGLGTVILYAAGNSNDVLDYYSNHPTTISVTAVSDVGLKSYYSSFGPNADIAAPSNGGLTGITTTAAGGDATDSFGGTSSACPFVAGVAGLMLAADPTLTAAEVRQMLKDTASPIDPVFGQYMDGHSDFYGAGLVNAYAAVAAASGQCTPPACVAPSDDCGGACGTATMCDPCRTHADCMPGSVCQSMPSIGYATCVSPVQGSCPQGTFLQGGHCLPEPETCGACGGEELCNGRDDDCNGEVDDGGACEGSPLCFEDGAGCPDGTVCAGFICVTACDDDDDCDSGSCETVKSQYGATGAAKGCVASNASQCQVGCEVLVSSLEDEPLASFVTCVDDANFSCGLMQGCALSLPVNF